MILGESVVLLQRIGCRSEERARDACERLKVESGSQHLSVVPVLLSDCIVSSRGYGESKIDFGLRGGGKEPATAHQRPRQ